MIVSTFTDALGQEWRLEFDGFLLDRIEKEAKVDLADLSAGGLLAVERDVKALVRVLSVACDEQLKAQRKPAAEFQKQIRKEAITRARRAVMEALADFFPESEWSAIQSSLTTLKNQTDQMKELEAIAPAFSVLPDDVKAQLFREEIERAGSLPSSPDVESAPAPDTMLPMPAADSPESATSAPETSPSETSG
jgi:hypothetical protein